MNEERPEHKEAEEDLRRFRVEAREAMASKAARAAEVLRAADRQRSAQALAVRSAEVELARSAALRMEAFEAAQLQAQRLPANYGVSLPASVQYVGVTNPYIETVNAGGVQQNINVVPGQVLNLPTAIAVFLLGQQPNIWIAANGWAPPSPGPPSGPVVTVTFAAVGSGGYPITAANVIVLADTTGGAFPVFLPDATQFTNSEFEAKAITAGTNLTTLTAINGQLIDGVATVPLGSPASSAIYNAVTVLSDGSPNWRII